MVIHFYRLAGFFLLILAAIGVVLPLLPTTPFVLLAALCFSKSSQRWHQWLLQSPTFGPGLLRWEQQRCLNCRTKVVALFSSRARGREPGALAGVISKVSATLASALRA